MTKQPTTTKTITLREDQWKYILDVLLISEHPFLEPSDTMELETIQSLKDQIDDTNN